MSIVCRVCRNSETFRESKTIYWCHTNKSVITNKSSIFFFPVSPLTRFEQPPTPQQTNRETSNTQPRLAKLLIQTTSSWRFQMSTARRRASFFFEMVRHEEGNIYQRKKSVLGSRWEWDAWRSEKVREWFEDHSVQHNRFFPFLAGNTTRTGLLTETLLEIQPRITKRLQEPVISHKSPQAQPSKIKINAPDTSTPTLPHSTPYYPQDTQWQNTPPHSALP